MDNILTYLLRVTMGSALMFTVYFFLFSKDTFHRRNRLMLLSSLIFPFIIPLLTLPFAIGNLSTYSSSGTFMTVMNTGELPVSDSIRATGPFSLKNLIMLLYFSGMMVVTVRFLSGLAKTLIIIRRGLRVSDEFPYLILTENDDLTFSFFPYVVLPRKIFESGKSSSVLEHEKAHVNQLHTLDLVICQFLTAIVWFNPVIWLIKRELMLTHEYLADQASIDKNGDMREYQYSLLNIDRNRLIYPVAHNFHSTIKNRIVMINKKPTRNIARAKNLIMIPVVAALLIFFSFRSETASSPGTWQDAQLSQSSTAEILKFVATNMMYPASAKNALDTATIYINVKIKKEGIVAGCTAFTDKSRVVSKPVPEIVVVGYKSQTSSAPSSTDHAALKTECERVCNKLGSLNIPEWKVRDCELTIPVKFVLK